LLNIIDPIDCINYLETELNKTTLENDSEVFALKQYKARNKIKFVVLDFEKKNGLSSKLYRNNNFVTSITVSNK